MTGLQNLNVDGEDQYMPGQKRDVTYVSRLQVSINIYSTHITTHHTIKRLATYLLLTGTTLSMLCISSNSQNMHYKSSGQVIEFV